MILPAIAARTYYRRAAELHGSAVMRIEFVDERGNITLGDTRSVADFLDHARQAEFFDPEPDLLPETVADLKARGLR